MKRTCSYRLHLPLSFLPASIAFLSCIAIVQAQDRFLSEAWPLPSAGSRIDPVFQSAKNIAVLSRIPGASAGIKSISVNGMRMLATTTDAWEGFRFFSMDSMNTVSSYGLIKLDSGQFVRDVEAIVYPGGITKLFLSIGVRDSSARLYGVNLTARNLGWIQQGTYFLRELDSLQDNNLHSITDLEMLYRHENRLFIAGNTDTLKYFDISNPDTMIEYKTRIDPIITLPTNQISYMKIHEVKGTTLANGRRLIGLGIPRGGMCIVEFDTDWSMLSTRFQMYDGARTLFPETVLNPNKTVYNNTYAPDSSRTINNKWDHRACHSVIPYDQGAGRYVLTVDEYYNFPGYQDKAGMWLPSVWELNDFFRAPTDADENDELNLSESDTAWYNHLPQYYPDGRLRPVYYRAIPNEPFSHRLNFIHRNYPGRHATDPNKFQGAFVRIWNRDSLWHNDTTGANNRDLIVGAYDIQEEPDNHIGYFGINSIPDTSFVPSGLHEPILSGRRLYLAGYNSGARVLDVNGADIRLRGYCRTEAYLSNDTNSVNFYARPDIYMYAKGIYRLIPDLASDDVLFGSDIYNGTWIMRFCDSTISGILRHDTAFQKTLDIGTVESIAPLTFDVLGDAIVSDSAHIRFTDNTTFRFNGCDSLTVRGILEVGSVTFTSSSSCTVPRIACKRGSKLLLGGTEKIINGLRTIDIDSCATAEILAGSTINMDSLATIFVSGTLIVRTATVNPHFKIVCRHGGRVIIDEGAALTGLKYIRIEKNGVLEVRNGAVVQMDRGGTIVVNGVIDTRGVRWARFQSMYASVDTLPAFGDYWLGIELDNPYDTSSVLHNLFIHHGDPGVFTNKTEPRIDSCVFSWNYIGLTVYVDSPELRNNRFEHNCFAGLNGQFMSTVVTGNRFNGNNKTLNGGPGIGRGVFLYHCGNLWLDDRLDSNYIGLDAFEWVDVPFNPWGRCDTVNGTSIRDNRIGAWVQEASNIEFNCDNSVHGNVDAGVGKDFILAANTGVVGWGNYADSASMAFIVDPSATLQWGDPSGQYPPPLSDPVLRKEQSGSRPAQDTNFIREMRLARGFRSLGQYTAAAARYRAAISYVRYRPEAQRCLTAWQQLFADASVNAPNTDAMSLDPSSSQREFTEKLASLASSADSLWLRNTAGEVLAFEKMRVRQDDSAIAHFAALAAMRGTEPNIARRALTALVILHNTCKHDYRSALDAHDILAAYYPGSKSLSYAKVLLRLPLSEENERALKPSLLKTPDEHVDARESRHSREGLEQPWPNPFSTTTSIRYFVESGGTVTLSVFDIQGREVRQLVSCSQSPGSYLVHFKSEETRTGRYFFRLSIRDPENGMIREYHRPLLVVK